MTDERVIERLIYIFYTGGNDTLYVSSALHGDSYEISGVEAEIITNALINLLYAWRNSGEMARAKELYEKMVDIFDNDGIAYGKLAYGADGTMYFSEDDVAALLHALGKNWE